MEMFFELDNMIGVRIEKSPDSELLIVQFEAKGEYKNLKI